MKAFAKKELQTLSLITPRWGATDRKRSFPIDRPESSVRVLRPVESDPVRRPRLSTAEIMRRLSLLSIVDVTRVNQVTIREGESHCVWPPEILEKFRSAEVITETAASHYVLREVNVTRIK